MEKMEFSALDIWMLLDESSSIQERKRELISPMKNVQITAQYIALERTDNGAIDAHFSIYPRVEYNN